MGRFDIGRFLPNVLGCGEMSWITKSCAKIGTAYFDGEQKMRTLSRSLFVFSMIAVGYLLGVSGLFLPAESQAQVIGDESTDETTEKVRAASGAVLEAMQALQDKGRYRPAIVGLNTFAVSVGGGIDAIGDLESGRGVDPETFAGLYAGQAIPEVAEYLETGEDGRLRYKNKLVRLYSISRLRTLFAVRKQFTGTDQLQP